MDYKKDDRHDVPGTVGIDIGSSSTRAVIHYLRNVKVPGSKTPVVKEYDVPLSPHKDGKYNLGDFSSLCNLTGNGKIYIDEDDVKNEETNTIKLAILLLTGVKDETLENYRLMRVIRYIHDQGEEVVAIAKYRAKKALECLLARILVEVKKTCGDKRVYIEAVGFTIPAHWGVEVETFLDQMFRSVFELPDNKQEYLIMCVFEIDAWARFYLEETMRDETALADYLKLHGSAVILFIDAGGYSMGSCIYHVFLKDGEIFHVVMDDAAGATGGSGHWNRMFRQYCKEENHVVDEEILHELDVQFDQKKYTMTGTEDVTMYTSSQNVTLPGPEIISTWNAAHKGTVKFFTRKLTKLLKLESQNYLILVSGGSSHHSLMRQEMKDICDRLGVPAEKLIHTQTSDMGNKTLRLAKGLNFALKLRRSVTQYIKDGGGFALQRASANKTHVDWDDYATKLFGPDSKVMHDDNFNNYCLRGTFQVHHEKAHAPEDVAKGLRDSVFKIIGFPYATAAKHHDAHVDHIAVGSVSPIYDLVSLGALSPGTYHMVLRYEEIKDTGKVSLTMKKLKDEQLGNEDSEAHLCLSVVYDVSAGVALCKEAVEDIATKVALFREKLFGEVAEEARAAVEAADKKAAEELEAAFAGEVAKSAFAKLADDGGEFVPGSPSRSEDGDDAAVLGASREARPRRARDVFIYQEPDEESEEYDSDEDAAEGED